MQLHYLRLMTYHLRLSSPSFPLLRNFNVSLSNNYCLLPISSVSCPEKLYAAQKNCMLPNIYNKLSDIASLLGKMQQKMPNLS